jgi:beta-xylosidase
MDTRPDYKPAIWAADQGDGTYRNPILYADYSDPDVIRAGDDFYMVASSFNCTPGIPILHSKDLVNWSIINHVFDHLPFSVYDKPAHGQGAWAPSIRCHAGKYWVFFSTPDEGIFMSTAAHPAKPWSPLTLVRAAKGWIDPCPFWDEDGQAYLIHAFAKSRAGVKSILHICRMSSDGAELLDNGRLVFDGTLKHPTIEGPKLFKRNGYYYIFAPAGGVPHGWQAVLRARNIYGPYEDKIVMAQGSTTVNGPHQGGWVELASGEDWFVHFQDRGACGRVVHLQPLRWVDDWPIIGDDRDSDGVGEPVDAWRKPRVGKSYPVVMPSTSDEFNCEKLGLQWQWHANPQANWLSLTERTGHLRLYPIRIGEPENLADVPNLLLQKFPAPAFTVTTQITFTPGHAGEQAGLVIMGKAYAYVSLRSLVTGLVIAQVTKPSADQGSAEIEDVVWNSPTAYLRVSVQDRAICQFSYSENGQVFQSIGTEFRAAPGVWIGARIGLFCIASNAKPSRGFADFDWFRFDSI